MQVVDSSGNVFGQGLEITDKNGKPKVPVINTDITIGTTTIVGGVVNRILFQGTGNVVQESPNITWDNTNKIFKVSTGTEGIVLEGDASGYPTFKINTLRSGATRRNWMFATEQINAGDFVLYRSSTGGGIANTLVYSIFNDGNFGLNTSTNAGYKADINGTLRVQSSLSIFNPSFTNGGTIAHTANSTLYITGGPGAGGENITFGPSNRIFINAQQTRFPNGSVQMSSTLTVGSGNATSTNMLLMQGSITAGSALGRGIGMDTTLVASANNDVLIGLDIKPIYTNGAFTGVTNVDLRTNGANVTIGSSYGYGALYGYANDGLVQIKTAATYKTQMWFRPSGNANNYNANYWSRVENDSGTMNIFGSNYGALYIASNAGGGNGAGISFSGATGVGTNALSILGPTNSGRIALTTYASSPITINGGNLLVNTLIDAGYKGDINGTLRVNSVFYVTNSSFTGNIRIESIANMQQRIVGANGENITWGPDNAIRINAGETYVSGSFLGGGFWIQNNGATVLGAQATAAASALLDIRSTSRGFLPPRMTTTQKNAIATPAVGLVIFDTTLNKLCVYTTAWETITSI